MAFAATKQVAKPDQTGERTPGIRVAEHVETPPGQPFAPAARKSWREALEDAIRVASADKERSYPTAVLTEISGNLRSPADRVPFLDALTTIDEEIADASDWSLLLSRVLKEWERTPAVQQWCRVKLPAVLSKYLSVFSRWLRYRQGNLDDLLERTGANATQLTELLLDGIAESGARMGSVALFGVAFRIVAQTTSAQAKRILDWYLDRLVLRLPAEDRSRFEPLDAPTTMPEATSRFLYGLLSDIDTRVRWRAAHAVRSLARLDDDAAVTALFSEFGRVSDRAFRDPEAPFYHLGAQLWLALVAYRLSDERPKALAGSVDVLLRRRLVL